MITASPKHRGTLVGREREQQALEGLLENARRGRGAAIILRGEPGIGKSALCKYAVERADGFRVLQARGVEAELEIPFAGLFDLLRPVLEERSELSDAHRAALEGALGVGPPAAGERFAVYAAALSLLAAAAAEQPLLAVVDDAHWLDPSSAEALLFAARRLEADRVAMLFAVRDQLAGPEWDEVPELPVGPLGKKEATELVLRLTDGKAAPVARRLSAAAGGNPLALEELVSGLAEPELSGRRPLEEPLAVGRALEEAFANALQELPPESRTALVVAAACDTPDLATVVEALRVLEFGASSLEPAEAANLIELESGRVEFRHPLVRSAAYHVASWEVRRQAHAALAQVHADDPQRRAWHLAAAAVGPDEEAVGALRDAARISRRRGSHVTAATMLERAARLASAGEARARLLLRAAQSAQVSGHVGWACDLLDGAAEGIGDSPLRAEIIHLRGATEAFGGSPRPARDMLLAEADAVQGGDPGRAALMLLDTVMASIIIGDLLSARSAAERAVELTSREGDAPAELARAVLASVLFLRGEGGAAGTLGERTDELLAMPGFPSNAFWIVELGAADLIYGGNHDRARRRLDPLIGTMRSGSSLGVLVFALATRAQLDSRTARWTTAYADAAEAIELAAEAGQRPAMAWANGVMARIDAARGRADAARSHAAEAIELGRSLDIGSALTQGHAALGLLGLGEGDIEAAIDELETVRTLIEEFEVGHPAALPWAPDLTEAYARAGRADDAQRVLAGLERGAQATGSAWGEAVAARCRGLLCGEDQVEETFAMALAHHQDAPGPFDRARTELCFGERLRRAGQRTAARERLESALDTFERLGAEPWVARAREELGASARTARKRRDRSAVDELTPQELRVALVVAKGVTNREAAAELFVSPRTIATHLESIYRKLGINRRTELAGLVHTGELAPAEAV